MGDWALQAVTFLKAINEFSRKYECHGTDKLAKCMKVADLIINIEVITLSLIPSTKRVKIATGITLDYIPNASRSPN